MPTSYIKELAKKGKGSVAELERKWDEAKGQAAKQGKPENYQYITGIFKRMINASSLHKINASRFYGDPEIKGLLPHQIQTLKQLNNLQASKQLNMPRRLGKATLAHIWAARQSGHGAGIFFYCPETGRFLLVKRSHYGDGGGEWACLGGGVDQGETLEEAALRECVEEGQFMGEVELLPMYDHTSKDFVYHNFLGIVDSEFQPVLNEEHTEFGWFYPDDFPQPILEPFQEALDQSPLKNNFGF